MRASKHPLTWHQKLSLAQYTWAKLNHFWMDARKTLPDTTNVYLARLLYGTYVRHLLETPTNRKQAAEFTGLDAKTARSYIAQAIDAGFLSVQPSQSDRRVELLVPTKHLNQLMENDLYLRDWEMRNIVRELARDAKHRTTEAGRSKYGFMLKKNPQRRRRTKTKGRV